MDYFDIDVYSRKISTTSPEAQLWFDRGLVWTYSYNHEQAIECFQKALEHDPDCAMAHWGRGYTAGPNYNMEWNHFDDAGRAAALSVGYDAAQTALSHVEGVTAWEAALIRALPTRYPQA